MNQLGYENRRSEIATYFDKTAVDAWNKLTSDEAVSRVRATVRAGRAEMLTTLADWLPDDLHGRRILDAGCGTGLMAVELARRGADVVAIDLSPTLVQLARDRLDSDNTDLAGRIEFISGDMLASTRGHFDHVVAMDSLIHYETADMLAAIDQLAAITEHSLLITIAPRTPLLALMHKAGKLFPKTDRSPAIVPVSVKKLHSQFDSRNTLAAWRRGRDKRVDTGFYKSHAQELLKR